MMVAPGLGVIERSAATRRNPPHESRLLECVEGCVDGGQGDVRQPVRHGLEELLRSHVTIEFDQGTVDDEPLGGDAESRAPQRGDGAVSVGGGSRGLPCSSSSAPPCRSS